MARLVRLSLSDHASMSNFLADVPPDCFAIHAFCECGHYGQIDLSKLSPTMEIETLRARRRCQPCGGRNVGIGIVRTLGGAQYKLVRCE